MSPVPVVLVVLLAAALVAAAGFGLWRHRSLTRRVGSFDCLLLHGGRWVAGVAHYGATSLYWWRRRSLARRAARIWPRSRLEVVERRGQDPERGLSGPLLVRCRVLGTEEQMDLVMSPEAYAGLTSWLEGAPPVHHTVI